MSDSNPTQADPFGQFGDEFVEAFRQGKRPSVEEFARRYPEHADEIREMLPALVLMEKAKSADDAPGQPLPARAAAAAPLQQLGDYQILREVGRGGMGVVYEARQLSLGRHVAIKVLPSHALLDPRHLGRFQREARSAAKLHHTNIVPVYGVGEQDGLNYYVMQFIKGLALDLVLDELRRLRQPRGKQAPTPGAAPGRLAGGPRDLSAVAVARSLLSGQFRSSGPAGELKAAPEQPAAGVEVAAPSSVHAVDTSATIRLPGQTEASTLSESGHHYWQSVARVGMQVADALAHASSQGVLHRDIKPSNLLLDDTGNVWVTDFGLAKADTDGDNLTHTGDIVGTLRYMAPERFNGQGDLRSDIYSLGLTLYELLALRPAFDEKERGKLIKQVTTEEPARLNRVNPGVPRDLVTIIHKAADRDPARRYATAGDLAADLQRFLADEPIKARRQTQLERYLRWARHHPGIAVLGGVLTAVLVLVTVASLLAAGYFDRAARSERNARQEAEDARAKAAASAAAEAAERQKAQRTLYHSLVGESRATRTARQVGYRERVFELLREASQLETPDRDFTALRREAAEALGDFVGNPPRMLPRSLPPRGPRNAWFDPLTQRLAISQAGGKLRFIDPAEGSEVASLSVPGGEILRRWPRTTSRFSYHDSSRLSRK
jgi:serine/threonine protein kinase